MSSPALAENTNAAPAAAEPVIAAKKAKTSVEGKASPTKVVEAPAEELHELNPAAAAVVVRRDASAARVAPSCSSWDDAWAQEEGGGGAAPADAWPDDDPWSDDDDGWEGGRPAGERV